MITTWLYDNQQWKERGYQPDRYFADTTRGLEEIAFDVWHAHPEPHRFWIRITFNGEMLCYHIPLHAHFGASIIPELMTLVDDPAVALSTAPATPPAQPAQE